MQSWSVGILCYNEEGSLRSVFEKVMNLLHGWDITTWEILLVDDGSKDGTPVIIHELAASDVRIKPIYHTSNLGIGEGIRSIYFNATCDNVVFVPGDGQFDVMELEPYREMDPSIFISFYRRENQTYNAFRNVLSWMNKVFNQLVLGLKLRDVNWVKVYKTELLTRLDLRLHSSAIESEICAKLHLLSVRCLEVQSTYLPRTFGSSKGASFKSIYLVIKDLFKLFFAVSAFRFNKHKHISQ